MIFNVNNTKVEVLIPDIVPKLKPELADQLYANHEPNEIYEMRKYPLQKYIKNLFKNSNMFKQEIKGPLRIYIYI